MEKLESFIIRSQKLLFGSKSAWSKVINFGAIKRFRQAEKPFMACQSFE